ncbi:hypothetical protein POJ06DRAFT_6974 [Lipomyces tetrasporus]|uniref:SET domain-containing protein n=1 Tax=Lipomyces tetrasporus TaxID=54092 RepID=A0AAD7VWC0_9ASCO|nr:uncharacterized protein POJ06DRAFT_6974 [Lipomyces tetrasporus]KAJ8103779.1 hypothetical protein POJ06DRAFT_6974 [Lipomyces tetrasporus]
MCIGDMEKIPDFIDFVLENDIEVSPYLDICYSPSRGYHILLSSDVKNSLVRNTPLARIPKSAVLSASSSLLCNLLPDDQQRSLAGLVLAYLTEKALGNRSPWYRYLDMLPIREESCLRFWGHNEQEWVRDTDAADILRAADEDLLEMYDTVATPFYESQRDVIKAAIGKNISWKDFISKKTFADALSVVAARCFEIDAFIGLGLCPIADLFNHSDHEDVHFETRYEVCEWCGSNDTCEHDAHALREAAGEDEDEVESDAEPPVIEDGDNFDINDICSESDEDDNDDDKDSDTCDIVVHKRIVISQKGLIREQKKEVFNSYGPLSSAQLLVKYGFAIRRNAHDYLSLEREMRALYRENGIPWRRHENADHDMIDGAAHVGRDAHVEEVDGPSGQDEWEDMSEEEESTEHEYDLGRDHDGDSTGHDVEGELKIDMRGRTNVHLWNRLVLYCVLTGGTPSANAYRDVLSVFNSSQSSLSHRLSETARHVIETLRVLLSRRWDRYSDGGIFSTEYDYVISEEVASRGLTDQESKKRNALIVLANEKEMLELAKARCDKALGEI